MQRRLSSSTLSLPALAIAALLVGASPAPAADQAGTIVAVEGTVDIGRAEAWLAAEVGGEILVGDQLRTGTPGRVRMVLLDESVVNVGDDSLFTIDAHVFNPDAGTVNSFMKLLKGKVRSLVSEYYEDPLASFEIETVTAVSGVRGTEFVVVYDGEAETTEIVGISGRVEVHSVLAREDRSVFVTAGRMTSVVRGGFPTDPRPVAGDEMRRYLRGVQAVGSGGAESMTFDEPVLQGGSVPPEDAVSAPDTAAPTEPGGEPTTDEAADEGSDEEGGTSQGGGGDSVPYEPDTFGGSDAFEQDGLGSSEDRSTPGDALDQPPPVLEKRGEVLIQFQRGGPRQP